MTDTEPSLIPTLILDRQAEAQKRGVLNVWTIYDRPRDHPQGYVARRFETGNGSSEPLATDDAFTGELHAIREAFAHCGLVCLTRSEDDQPQIVESWL